MDQVKHWIKKNFSSWIYRSLKDSARKKEIIDFVKKFKHQKLAKLSDVSYDIFTYHGEDGIIFYLINQMDDMPATFVDIGAGDCIKSNCAMVAEHFGWKGVFIDRNEKQLDIGVNFYKKKKKPNSDLQFLKSEITDKNIDEIILSTGIQNEVGLLSIDLDGNDYWVWKSIEVIKPYIVVIEAKVEFGLRNLVVPYSKENHHSFDNMYNGASVEALKKLGEIKGYKLVGANQYGYNLFFVRKNSNIPEVTTAEILDDPSIRNSFYPESFFARHKFIEA